jgi:hypothetical protein
MLLFKKDGTLDLVKVRTLIIDQLLYASPRWIVPTNSGIYAINSGYGSIVYNGPQPRIVKL